MILRPFNGFVPNYGRKGGRGGRGGRKREVGFFFFFLFSTLNALVRGTKATGQLSDV